MQGVIASLHLLLLSLGLVSHTPPKSPESILQQTLTCRITDRKQDMETRLTVHESGAVTIQIYSVGVKHAYKPGSAIIRDIPVEEAHYFMKGVKQRALQAGTITEMRHAPYLMDIDLAYSNQNERYWYDMYPGHNSAQVDALHRYIENFIHRQMAVRQSVSERDYK